MISRFKLKTHTTQGIEVESPSAQASDIATMIKATSFSVDSAEGTATFKVESGQTGSTYTVAVGQVICITNGAISVMSREAFFDTFELDA